MQNSVARAHTVLPPWLPHDPCTPKASLRGTLACVPFADRVCSRFPALRGASSRRARVTFERASHTRKKTEGVEVSELRVDRAVVLSAGSTFAPFHLRPRIRRTSGRSIGSTPPLPFAARCTGLQRRSASPPGANGDRTRSYSTTSH